MDSDHQGDCDKTVYGHDARGAMPDDALRAENQRLRREVVRLIREWWRGPGRLLEVLPDATDDEREAARVG